MSLLPRRVSAVQIEFLRSTVRRRLVLSLCVILSIYSYSARGEVGRAWNVEAIPWERTAQNGTKYALLEGSRDAKGASFTYAFFIPAGVWDSPHWHSTTARVFVAKGALSIGFGDNMDKAQAATYAAGSIVVVPAGAHHFDGSSVDTIIIGVATGPWSTTYLDGSLPASAGTPIQ